MADSQALGHSSQLPLEGLVTGVQKHSLFHQQTYKPALHVPTSHTSSINLQGLPRAQQGLKYFLQPGMRCKELAQPVGMVIPAQQSSLLPPGRDEWLCQLSLSRPRSICMWKLLNEFQSKGHHTCQKLSAYNGKHATGIGDLSLSD